MLFFFFNLVQPAQYPKGRSKVKVVQANIWLKGDLCSQQSAQTQFNVFEKEEDADKLLSVWARI